MKLAKMHEQRFKKFLNVSILKELVFLELYADDLDHTHVDFLRKVALENNKTCTHV